MNGILLANSHKENRFLKKNMLKCMHEICGLPEAGVHREEISIYNQLYEKFQEGGKNYT